MNNKLKLFLVINPECTDESWNTFRRMVVVATDEMAAANIHPAWGEKGWGDRPRVWPEANNVWGKWVATPSGVDVVYIGDAEENLKDGQVLITDNVGE